MMKKILITGIMVMMVMGVVIAQPVDPPDPDIPVTGGILYLLLAGIGYGAYHIKKKIKGE